MDGSTPAFAHSAFISRQIWRRESGCPFLVRKISPETVLFFLAYFSSFRQSFAGSRMVRTFTTRIYLMTTGAEHAKQLERLGLVT